MAGNVHQLAPHASDIAKAPGEGQAGLGNIGFYFVVWEGVFVRALNADVPEQQQYSDLKAKWKMKHYQDS